MWLKKSDRPRYRVPSSTRPRARLSWALLGRRTLKFVSVACADFHLASGCRLRPLPVVSGYLLGFSDLTSVPKLHQSRASRIVCGGAVRQLRGASGQPAMPRARAGSKGRTDGHVISRCQDWEGQEVDWKRLVQFALLGSSGFEQYAILLVRISIGLFFAISGANKLFVAGGTKPVYDTLVKSKVPFPRQTAYFVSGVEFVGGCLVAAGFLSSLACAALLVDMLVAILTAKLSAMPKGLSPLKWFDNLFYLPEVLYVLFFIWLICSGPGKFSVHYWLAGKLRR